MVDVDERMEEEWRIAESECGLAVRAVRDLVVVAMRSRARQRSQSSVAGWAGWAGWDRAHPELDRN